jgi:hypothetical protein
MINTRLLESIQHCVISLEILLGSITSLQSPLSCRKKPSFRDHSDQERSQWRKINNTAAVTDNVPIDIDDEVIEEEDMPVSTKDAFLEKDRS